MILDPRIRWALRGQMWPKYWSAIHFIKCSSIGERTHLDLIGPPGIGKTHFSKRLATNLGVRSPANLGETKYSSEHVEFFEITLSAIGEKILSPGIEWEKKVQKITHLSNRFELERKALHRPAHALFLNDESLVRHGWDQIVGLATVRPEFITNLLRDRLILVCDADDPADRILKGRKKRGEDVTDSPQFRQKLNEQMFRIREAAIVLASLGVPVLTINLDRSISYNVPLVAKFLHENAVTSRKIKHLAKRTL